MSHTTVFKDNEGNDWTCQHDAFNTAGKVRFQCPNGVFRIPAEVMVAYVAGCVAAEKIDQLEQAEPYEILGLKP